MDQHASASCPEIRIHVEYLEVLKLLETSRPTKMVASRVYQKVGHEFDRRSMLLRVANCMAFSQLHVRQFVFKPGTNESIS